MSSSTEGRSEIALRVRGASIPPPQSFTSFALRGGGGLVLVRPGSLTSLPVDATGTYFCITVSGAPVVRSDSEQAYVRYCKPNSLLVLRQPCERSPRRIEFVAAASLAVIVHFPPSWCASCPRGPECQVAHFLMRGAGGDLEIELDDRSLAHAKALLELSLDTDGDILTAEQAILALLAWAYAKHGNPQVAAPESQILPPRTVTKLRLAVDILSQRLDDPPTITELSILVGMNECDLKRCFKCRYGDSIASFSRNKRLAVAQNLLLHSDLTVAEIALEAGFANPSQFARAFRRQFDLNPAQYRTSRGKG